MFASVCTKMIDFKECSACPNPSVDIRTEVVISDRPGITKMVICRCEEHISCDAETMRELCGIKLKKLEHKNNLK